MIGKNMKNCMPCPPKKNDSRGPTFALNFSSAIGWIQTRFALPLAQTTNGGDKQNPYPHTAVFNVYTQLVLSRLNSTPQHPERPNQRSINVEYLQAQHPSRANQPRAFTRQTQHPSTGRSIALGLGLGSGGTCEPR